MSLGALIMACSRPLHLATNEFSYIHLAYGYSKSLIPLRESNLRPFDHEWCAVPQDQVCFCCCCSCCCCCCRYWSVGMQNKIIKREKCYRSNLKFFPWTCSEIVSCGSIATVSWRASLHSGLVAETH